AARVSTTARGLLLVVLRLGLLALAGLGLVLLVGVLLVGLLPGLLGAALPVHAFVRGRADLGGGGLRRRGCAVGDRRAGPLHRSPEPGAGPEDGHRGGGHG